MLLSHRTCFCRCLLRGTAQTHRRALRQHLGASNRRAAGSAEARTQEWLRRCRHPALAAFSANAPLSMRYSWSRVLNRQPFILFYQLSRSFRTKGSRCPATGHAPGPLGRVV